MALLTFFFSRYTHYTMHSELHTHACIWVTWLPPLQLEITTTYKSHLFSFHLYKQAHYLSSKAWGGWFCTAWDSRQFAVSKSFLWRQQSWFLWEISTKGQCRRTLQGKVSDTLVIKAPQGFWACRLPRHQCWTIVLGCLGFTRRWTEANSTFLSMVLLTLHFNQSFM